MCNTDLNQYYSNISPNINSDIAKSHLLKPRIYKKKSRFSQDRIFRRSLLNSKIDDYFLNWMIISLFSQKHSIVDKNILHVDKIKELSTR